MSVWILQIGRGPCVSSGCPLDSYYAGDEDHHLYDDDDDDDDVYQEFEELDFSELPDTKSIVSDDSFYPPDDSLNFEKCQNPESPEPISFFKACCTNNAIIVKIMIRQGVTEEEVREVDKNNRTGLIVACYQGYVDVVIALSHCPYVDVNWQDNEGNTALMTAAQAGKGSDAIQLSKAIKLQSATPSRSPWAFILAVL
uniref:Ankyrin repeat domain 33Bb n=1 Tax=Cyprinus carpio TaxID=7962 RepID=A0A8C2L405_CYPCA